MSNFVGPKRALAAVASPSATQAVASNVASSAVKAAAAASVAASPAASTVASTVASTAAVAAVKAAAPTVVETTVKASSTAVTATAAAAASAATVAAVSSTTSANATDIANMVHEWVKLNMFKDEKIVATLTAIYFGYVVLGGINHDLHHHIYTGDENESVFQRLKKMKPVVFREEVYDEFFSFKDYFTTYQIHVLTAGIWLVTGAYNLRYPPQFALMEGGKPVFDGWLHARLSGYAYAISSFLKGVTATVISLKSHSLGWARYPMAIYGVYDVISLFFAMDAIRKGRIQEHKEWMIRNFSVGAGSIWVRVFGAIWALFDLDFMKSNDMYRKMNNVILFTGFTQGILFGEFWLAKDDAGRKKYAIAQAVNAILTLVGAYNVYRELAEISRLKAMKSDKDSSLSGDASSINRRLNF